MFLIHVEDNPKIYASQKWPANVFSGILLRYKAPEKDSVSGGYKEMLSILADQ